MQRHLLLGSVLLAFAGLALGMPSWYSCDPASCLPPSCQCAGTDSPPVNGTLLPPDQIPQFIVITHDDAINFNTNDGMRKIIDQHTNRNGCNVPATFFVLQAGNQCEFTKLFYEQNSEIALHTVNHLPLNDPFSGPGTLEDNMLGVRTYLNETCGIPLEDMVGFRCPLLFHNPPVREVLAKNGMLYDSSIIEWWPSQTSPDAAHRLWPYTMDKGIPQDCAFFSNKCDQAESYPGMWEFPLLDMQNVATGELLYSMDPGGAPTSQYSTGSMMAAPELTELLKANFNASYYGNRAPWGIYVHTPWLTDSNIQATNDFLTYALELPDTWVVTVRQVIEWMQNPVPASQMADWLKCRPVDLTNLPGTKKCQLYTAVNGDYGAKIAADFGVSEADLLALNPDLDKLAIGATVKIPPFDDSCGAGTPVTGPSFDITIPSDTAAADATLEARSTSTPSSTTSATPSMTSAEMTMGTAATPAAAPTPAAEEAAATTTATATAAAPTPAPAPAPNSGASAGASAALALLMAAAGGLLALLA